MRGSICLLLAGGVLLSPLPSPAAETHAAEGQAASGDSPARREEIRAAIVAGEYSDAAERARSLLPLTEETFGADSVETALVLDLLAEALWRGGNVQEPETEAILARALAIKERRLGVNHPEYALTLKQSANLQYLRGKYREAKSLYERVIAILEGHFGPESLEVAKLLHNLAVVGFEMTEFERARDLLRRALSIYEQFPEAEERAVARSLNTLGNVLWKMGDYTEGTAVLEQALEVYRRIQPDHPEVGLPLTNLANIFHLIGDYGRAEQLNQEALEIYRRSLGMEHSLFLQTQHNLGNLAFEQGNLERARTIFEEVLPPYERTLGRDHPIVSRTLESLGNVYLAIGSLERALPLLEEVHRSREQSLGPDHAELAEIRHNLGEYFKSSGDYPRAKEFLGSAAAILEKSLGPGHPEVGKALSALAEIRALNRENSAALDAALRAEGIALEHLRLTARSLSERQALRYASVRTRGLDLALSLVSQGLESSHGRTVWDTLIRSRALVLDEVASRNRLVHGAADISRLAADLYAANQRLANLSVRGPGEDPAEVYRQLLDGARRDKEEAERALAGRSVAFQQLQARGPIGAVEVAAAVPPNSVLLSFVRYERYPLPSGPGATSPNGGPGRDRSDTAAAYLAVLFRSGQREPHFVPLGLAVAIESSVSNWRGEAGGARFLLHRPQEEAESAYREAAASLRRLVWDPVASHLAGADLVLVVPDGALHLVNFSALPGEAHAYLLEEGPRIHYLSSEKDLVRPGGLVPKNRGLLALGGPDFDTPGRLARGAEGKPVQVASAGTFRGERSECEDFHSVRFPSLPGSLREVEEIASLWSGSKGDRAGGVGPGGAAPPPEVNRLTGLEADEGSFKERAHGKRVLHLATHGFFLGGRCPSALDRTRGIGGLVGPEPLSPPPVAGENPLLLSGLALAGANRRDAAGPVDEDGILTAEEIAALDLAGVEWAVLSGCDTGVGEVKAGEGVFGLRRAFQVAGAGTLIMTLWSVEDESARAWMRRLYEARLDERLGTAEAVRRASLEVLRERREKGQSTHPFYWGAFVAAGEWR